MSTDRGLGGTAQRDYEGMRNAVPRVTECETVTQRANRIAERLRGIADRAREVRARITGDGYEGDKNAPMPPAALPMAHTEALMHLDAIESVLAATLEAL